MKDELQVPSADEEEMLEASCHCYELGLADDNRESQSEIVRRLGNVS